MTRTLWAAAAAALLLAGPVAAGTPAQNCESNKNKEAGKYAECRQKAESTFALTGNEVVRAIILQGCGAKYDRRWPAIEDRSAGMCPSTGDQTALRQYLDSATSKLAAALSGEPLAGQGRPLQTGQVHCWDVAGQPVSCAFYSGHDGGSRQGAERGYVDNGDGTITDTATGLMWEKLSDDTGVHDKDRSYTWAQAFAQKIATLNAEAFAGYTDWRLPNLNELQSLLNYGTVGPAVSPAFNVGCTAWCTVSSCSCTLNYQYWSSTSFQNGPSSSQGMAWYASFHEGRLIRGSKTQEFGVRAVRGGV